VTNKGTRRTIENLKRSAVPRESPETSAVLREGAVRNWMKLNPASATPKEAGTSVVTYRPCARTVGDKA
jgi:hypothetical protein